MTNRQDEPATITPSGLVQLLIAEGFAGDEAAALLLVQEAEALPERDKPLRFIVPATGGPPMGFGGVGKLPIDYRNDCAWNSVPKRDVPARVLVFARPSQVHALLNRLRERRDQAARERGIAARPPAMLDAIGLAIGDGHERAEEVLQQALHKVETRELAVSFASNLDTWRKKFAEWHPGPAARPWLRVSADECEALGNAEGCAPGGEVPRSPVWRINTAAGLAERQDERGAWRPVGPVVVEGEALRKLAVDHVATAPTDAGEGSPASRIDTPLAPPWDKDGPEWEAAQRDLIEWADNGDGWPSPTERSAQARFAKQLQQFAHQRGKDMGETTAKKRVKLLLEATHEQRETWCRWRRP
jgi:hypothetical protein